MRFKANFNFYIIPNNEHSTDLTGHKQMHTQATNKPPLLSIPKSRISLDKNKLAASSTSTSTGSTIEGLELWLVLIRMKEV